MKGLIMLNKIKNVFSHNKSPKGTKQITIRLANDNGNSIVTLLKSLFNFYPKYATQKIRIEKERNL